MKNKNIIFLSNAEGGIETFQNNLIRFFLDNKINVDLIDKKKIFLKKKDKKFFNFYKSDVIHGLINCIKTLRQINKKNFHQNIFIISNPTVLVIYFLLIKIIFNNSKIIFFFHSHLLNKSLVQIIFSFFTSIFSIFVSKCVFVSTYTKKWWNFYFPLTRLSNNYVIYNKIITSKKSNKKNYKKLSIAFVGRFEKEKGLQTFLNFANKIKNKKINFFIFGRGSIKIIRNKYKNLKFFSWSKKEFIYNKINLLFVTSDIENCPLNVLEAKSYGIPTITISNGGIKEIIKNNKDGFLLKKNISVDDLTKKFLYILKNYKSFEKNCYKNSGKFEINKYKKKFFTNF